MQLTKGAIGNLINRYKAVLKKCHLMNTFGSLAVAGMLIMGGAAAAGAATATAKILINGTDYTDTADINCTGAVDFGVYTNAATGTFTGKKLNVSTTPGELGGGNVGLWATSTSPESARSVINFGQTGTTESIDIEVTDNSSMEEISIGVWSSGGQEEVGGEINLSAETVTIKGHSNSGWIYGIYAQNTTTTTEYDQAVIDINAGKTYIDVTSGQPGRADAIVAMSQGIINIESDLYVNTQGGNGYAIVTRGDSTIAINTSGTHIVQMNGDINFNYDKKTSGTRVDADVDITLNGADSYWNGNTLISWDEKPDDSKLTVSEMTLTVKDGATWTPTAIEETADQKYTPLNNLILDDGNIDVNKGVEIAIDKVSGTGYLANEGTVTLTSGALEGRTENAGIINLDPDASISNVTFVKGDGVAGQNVPGKGFISVDAEGAHLYGGMDFGNAVEASVSSVAVSDNTTTITGASISKADVTRDDGATSGNNKISSGITATLADGKSLAIVGSNFADNKVTLKGIDNGGFPDGALLRVDSIGTSGNLTISNTEFTGNTYTVQTPGALWNGTYGGIVAVGDNQGAVVMDNVTISGNTVTDLKTVQGAGYWQYGGSIEATGLTVSGNTASVEKVDDVTINGEPYSAGGAMALVKVEGSIKDSDFSNNTNKHFNISSGGALFVAEDSNITLENDVFNENTATGKTAQGGAIYNEGTLTVEGGSFTDNSAAPADGSTVTVSNVGGAIYNADDAKLSINGTRFEGNTAAIAGAVNNQYDSSHITGITNAVFVNNTASLSAGGALRNQGTIGSIAGTTFEGNTAGNGGALWNGAGGTIASITDTTFTGNTAAGNGGAIYNAADSSITFKGTNTFTGNTAAEGKDIYNEGTLTMTGDSHLIVDGNQNIYNTSSATLTVNSGAKLTITDAVAGGEYKVVTGGNLDIETGAWSGDNLQASSDMVALSSNSDGTFTAEGRDAHTVFPNLSEGMTNAVNDLYAPHKGADGKPWNYADVNSDQMGVRFLSRATDNTYLGADKNAAAATIESAARIAFAGAVPQMTKMASDAGSNAVVNRLGFANPADGAQAMDAEGKIVDRNTTGFALWIAPLWQSQHGWGMEADNLDYGFNGNLGGVSLGADYTFENAIRAGITFNIGGGYAESSGGDLNSTENRMSFWGLGAYAGWNYENFGLMADVSYTSTWNDLQQDMDSRMGMGDLEADVQASAISAGLRAEYKLETSVLDVIPHIGVRYMSLNTWGFDAESNGGTVLEGDGFHQDIWTFPVGVTFTKDFTLDSGWSFKPSIDFSVIPAAGDIKAKQDVAFTGLPGSYEVETQMMDYLTWQGGVGLEMGNDTMSFGVNYTLQAGQHTTGHGVFGSFRYEF